MILIYFLYETGFFGSRSDASVRSYWEILA